MRKALNSQHLTIADNGSQLGNFIYGEDLAEAHVLVLDDVAKNQIFNLEGKRRITINEVANTIKKLMGDSVEIEYIPARLGDYKGKEMSNEKI